MGVVPLLVKVCACKHSLCKAIPLLPISFVKRPARPLSLNFVCLSVCQYIYLIHKMYIEIKQDYLILQFSSMHVSIFVMNTKFKDNLFTFVVKQTTNHICNFSLNFVSLSVCLSVCLFSFLPAASPPECSGLMRSGERNIKGKWLSRCPKLKEAG